MNYAIPTNKELSVPWGFVYNATLVHKDPEFLRLRQIRQRFIGS